MLGASESSPFDVRWRMFGIPVRIQPSYWIFCVIFGWDFIQRREWERFFIWFGVIFFSFFLKELGQVIIGRIFGVRGGIVLYAFGGGAVGDYAKMRRWQRIIFYASGPAFSFALYGIALACLKYPNLALLGNAEITVRRIIGITTTLNFLWGCLHLLPIYPLDGGMVVRELLEAAMGRFGLVLSLLISIGCAGGLAGWAGYVLWTRRFDDWPPYLGHPIFSLIFDSLLAFQSIGALMKVLRERPPQAVSDSNPETPDDYDHPAPRNADLENYRPFDGGRPDEVERRR